MMAAQKLSWQPDMRNVRGRLLENEPMSRHTSWRLGGPADWYFVPADLKDLQQFIGELPGDMPIYWIGLGSNLLVRDAGIRGVVIGTHKGLAAIQQVDGQLVRAEAGVASAQVARFCGRQHMMGAEFLAGIPGSFGGALAMNAGAFGGETWDIVDSVEVIDRKGTVVTRKADEFSPAYRHIDIEASNWFVAATIRLRSGDSSQSKSEILSLLKRRGDSQPVQSANAGSVFRNPPGDHAARLIEACGLKGTRSGGAEVSEKHANFIINHGDASAADVEALITTVQREVKTQCGVELVPEVRFVGAAK